METILEQQRRYHEEKERLMDTKTKEMLTKKNTVTLTLRISEGVSNDANTNRVINKHNISTKCIAI